MSGVLSETHREALAKGLVSPTVTDLLAFSSKVRKLTAANPAAPEYTLQAFQRIGSLPLPNAIAIMQAWLDDQTTDTPAKLRTALIQLRNKIWLDVCMLECSNSITLEQATTIFTAFAEIAIKSALTAILPALVDRHGTPIGRHTGQYSHLSIIALGRLGASELGPACDADLVFVFDEEGQTNGSRPIENQIFFNTLVGDLFKLLGEDGNDEFVLRLYNRRQPWAGNAPSACSLTTLERFVSTRLDEAERAIWISARVLYGPQTAVQEIIQPFVFRRFLDYTVFTTIREQHAALRREIALAGLNENIRHGPGGLREIEFLIQTFQLIRGGRDSRLRVTSTLAVIDAMVHRRELPTTTALELGEAYLFLRKLEHRLQYRDDDLIHTISTNSNDCKTLSTVMGFGSTAEFLEELALQRKRVQTHFESVFNSPDDAPGDPLLDIWREERTGDAAITTLRSTGHSNPEQSLALIVGLRESKAYQSMGHNGRHYLDLLMPALLRLCGEYAEPEEVLKRVAFVFESLCQRPVYLGLLTQYPSVLERLARFCSASPWVANFLARHPILLDELLYPEHLVETMESDGLIKSLGKLLDLEAEDSQERQMELCCEFRQIHTFRLIARELLLGMTPRELGNRLSILADSILADIVQRIWNALSTRHCETPRFAIIAYGKHGSRELSYASDLDLVFVYDDEHHDAADNYNRLAKRLLSWLNSVTAAGILFDIDMRLRPDGDSGVLVPSLTSLSGYLQGRAWTWEHQALTRARFAVGHPEVGARFEEIRREVLCQPRDLEKLSLEVLDMRRRVSEGHPNRGEFFNLKHDSGGLVDVEFAVQYLVLKHAVKHPELATHIDNAALLDMAGKLGLVNAGLAQRAAVAYEKLRKIQHALRLQGIESARTSPDEVIQEKQAIRELWDNVFEPRTTD